MRGKDVINLKELSAGLISGEFIIMKYVLFEVTCIFLDGMHA